MKKSQLEIQLSQVKGSENKVGKWQHYTFTAYDVTEPIAHISVDLVEEPKDPIISKDNFFMDFNFSPPKSRPYLFYMGTEEDYRGKGIAGRLIEFANEFFKNEFGTPLHSGIINQGSAPRVWEKLVQEKKATEYKCNGNRRWAMH